MVLYNYHDSTQGNNFSLQGDLWILGLASSLLFCWDLIMCFWHYVARLVKKIVVLFGINMFTIFERIKK